MNASLECGLCKFLLDEGFEREEVAYRHRHNAHFPNNTTLHPDIIVHPVRYQTGAEVLLEVQSRLS